MDKLVVSLETAKKLKDAGFPHTVFAWVLDETLGTTDPYVRAAHSTRASDKIRLWPAPTAQELADQLPMGWEVGPDHTGQYVVQAGGLQMNPEVGDTMAEALALLWLQVSKTSWPLFRKEKTK